MPGKLRDTGMHETLIVVIAHAYSLPVRAGVEDDFFIFSEGRVNESVKVEQITERRFGADFATGEKRAELLLPFEFRVFA
jgi:hypothetical protein